MRSKDLRNLRKAFENLQGSFDEVMKSTKSRSRKAASKKVAVKNEDFEDLEDEDLEDEDFGDEGVEDADTSSDESDADVLETAEAIVDLVESLPDEVAEKTKDEILATAADEVEDGTAVDEVVENVRRRVYNIRRKVNNARRARVKNARRIKNARRQRLFNAAVAEGLIKAAPKEYQSPISKFKNARRYRFFNDDASDLDAGLGDEYRDTDSGPSIGSFGRADDTGYGGDPDSNYDPNDRPTGKPEINTLRNARVRNIINKARAYDALMNGLGAGCAGGSCPAGKVNLNNKDERDAYNAGVLQNGRYVLHNGRVYAFNEGEDAFVPADTTAAPAAPGDPEAAAEDAAGGPYYDEEQNALVIPLSGAEEQALEEDLADEEAPEGALDTAAVAAGADMPGAGGVPAASEPPVPSYNQRQRRRVRNSRGYRSVYNQKGKTATKKTAATQETQVNNAAVETGLDIPSTFPTKKAE